MKISIDTMFKTISNSLPIIGGTTGALTNIEPVIHSISAFAGLTPQFFVTLTVSMVIGSVGGYLIKLMLDHLMKKYQNRKNA